MLCPFHQVPRNSTERTVPRKALDYVGQPYVDRLSVGEECIQFSSVVTTLGVTLDAALSLINMSQPLSGHASFMSDL